MLPYYIWYNICMDKNEIFNRIPKVTYGRGYVYNLQYHIVWCTKYRKKILTGDIDNDLKTLIQSIAEEQDVNILAMETMPDHIHLLIDTKPQCRLSDLIKVLKGTTAWYLFKRHPELKEQLYGGHLWNPSYFAATVSDRTEEQIKNYIDGQRTHRGIGGRPTKH